MNVRAHVVFHGRVQGVFFRASTRDRARQAGLRGWVRNLPDGAVEAVFEGEREPIEEVIDSLSHHLPYARVSRKDLSWSDFTGEFEDFEIRF